MILVLGYAPGQSEPVVKVETPIERLIINLPPSCAMSDRVSGLWPSWVWPKGRRQGIGSSFDDFLRGEDILEETQAAAQERVARWLLGDLWDPGLRYEVKER